ncbi:unnamed protein product, partial [Oppiella nova]
MSNASTTVPTLAYFPTRGLAQPIRLLLKYTGTPFDDKRYELGPDVPNLLQNFRKEKFTLGLDFPSVPYYLDGNVKLTQSIAILRYLGRKYGLVAGDEAGLVRQDLVEQQIQDIKQSFFEIIFKKEDFESKKDSYIAETLP